MKVFEMKWDPKRRAWMRGLSRFTVLMIALVCAMAGIGATTQFDLTTAVKGILPGANGGTNSAFFQVSGPTVLRTFTFPDSNATLEVTANKNAANGYLGADSAGKLAISQINATGTPSGTTVLFGNGVWAAPSGINFLDQSTPTGTIDGTNAAFTTSQTCIAASLMLFKNGQLMAQGASADYQVSGTTITYTTGAKPKTGDTHAVSCRY
jgi:hypothetical protein